MGAQERQSATDLNASEQDPGAAEAAAWVASVAPEAARFEFYRLVDRLERLYPEAPAVGETGPAKDERIRIRPETSLAFAASDVVELSAQKYPDGVERVRLTTAFMGLYGPSSPLPQYLTEAIARGVFQGGPQPVRDLMDVIHHRLFSLAYRVWTKYRLSVGYRQAGSDTFTKRMFCSVGLDAFGDAKTVMNPFHYLRFAPILASKSRSARGLQVMLDELLESVPVNVEQFVGHWTLIEKPLRNKLGVANHELGESLVLGRYVFDGGGRFALKLGPLNYDDYLSFLPGGHRRPLVRSVVDTVTAGNHDVMLKLEVDLEAAPRLQLGSPRSSTLSRTAWLGGGKGSAFSISVPLADEQTDSDEELDDDRGEPPPLPY